MFLFKGILIALTLMGSVNTAVLNIRTSPERRATQSCHVTYHSFWVFYSILIRVPYGGPTDCDATYHALESAAPISIWQCVEKNGEIQLWFNTMVNSAGGINHALESRYPSVDSFNCPDS